MDMNFVHSSTTKKTEMLIQEGKTVYGISIAFRSMQL